MAVSKESRAQEEQRLISATQWQKKPPKPLETIRSEVSVYLEQCSKITAKTEPVVAAFNELLGPLTRIYKPDRFERGILYVFSPAGPYLHQMKTMEHEIIAKLNTICPKAKIRAIRCNVNKH